MCELSVIMTSYNRSNTIRRAIDSVLSALEGIDYELIIVDDGSMDGSVKIIREYDSPRIRKYLFSHNGIMNTYGFALASVNGKFFTFCDCDDYWNEREIKDQLWIMDGFEINFTVTRVIIEKDGTRTVSEFPKDRITYDRLLMGKANIHAQTYMIRTEKFREYVDFSKFLKFNTWDLPICMEWIRKEPIYYLNIVTAVFCVNKESVTQTNSRIKRIRYLAGNYKIKLHFIRKYGCEFRTFLYLMYKLARDIYSICFKRWTR